MVRSTAIRLGNTSPQAMVRSAQADLNRSTSNRRTHPRKAAKARGSYLPEPKVLRIQQRYVAGENKSEIAKKEKVDRGTVARIVQFPEVQNFIAQAQQEFFGLVPDAMAAVRHAVQVEKNAMIALTVLERTGVSAHRGERVQLPAATAEDGYSRQAIMIANVLLEGREHMGLDLGPEIEEALAKDAQENTEAAEMSGTKLSRLSDCSGNASGRLVQPAAIRPAQPRAKRLLAVVKKALAAFGLAGKDRGSGRSNLGPPTGTVAQY